MTLKDRLKKFDLLPQVEEEKDDGKLVSPDIKLVCKEISKILSSKISSIPVWFDYSEEEQKELILNFLQSKYDEKFSDYKLTEAEKDKMSAMFLNSVFGFGPLDFLIAQKDVNLVIVEAFDRVFVEKQGQLLGADVVMDKRQYDDMLKKLLELSQQQASVVKFKLKHLHISIIRTSYNTKLIIKKISGVNFNFKYLQDVGIVNSDITAFLSKALTSGKKILITGAPRSGKTVFLNSLLNEFDQSKLARLFEDNDSINTENNNVLRFNLANKDVREEFIEIANDIRPDYIFFDSNKADLTELMAREIPFIASVRAYTPFDVVQFYINSLSNHLKCTRKTARSILNKCVDYIIHIEKVENLFVLSYILELSLTENDTPVLEELLTFQAGEYKYNLPKVELPDVVQKPVGSETDKKSTFSSRLNIQKS